MKLYRTKQGFYAEFQEEYYQLSCPDWDTLINRDDLHSYVLTQIAGLTPVLDFESKDLLPPAVSQEVWASGVTYYRSKVARMEESKGACGGMFYDKVYEAERPELFFKALGYKVVGSGGTVNIRPDSIRNVPEPEWTLYATTSGKIVGYTVGNDMSSKCIECENPLYISQAKIYDGSAALGPCLYVPAEPMVPNAVISIEVKRSERIVFQGITTLDQLKRTPDELIGWLYRSSTFRTGAFLMTGTGLVPSSDFTVEVGDTVAISIDKIGQLTNVVGLAKV
ncbi:2-hydroxyhepta-2,4-diene-1,7-dioate isomerase [Runella rosea]|uniref:2-hydroxyhepta-2,4-diene-1,7-dioate isomerase n=1 Tax=Runella rosea TaxID=2259595 RepID=A0A344THU7_9BACT|nr:fumarylacetoacetate hydrolase family protein [Runella rosea]AXE18218.1 2-hydroxyhepta-2,4-diene-1,7-dioate isomerase [Runella rosea]